MALGKGWAKRGGALPWAGQKATIAFTFGQTVRQNLARLPLIVNDLRAKQSGQLSARCRLTR